jgi:hypothetical protein
MSRTADASPRKCAGVERVTDEDRGEFSGARNRGLALVPLERNDTPSGGDKSLCKEQSRTSQAADNDVIPAQTRPQELKLVGEKDEQSSDRSVTEDQRSKKPRHLQQPTNVFAKKQVSGLPDEELQREVGDVRCAQRNMTRRLRRLAHCLSLRHHLVAVRRNAEQAKKQREGRETADDEPVV